MARVQREREALGQQLREMRREAGLTGTRLAELLGWNQPKVSKIETGRQTPSEEDIRLWARATAHEGTAEDLIAKLHSLETMYAEWRRQLRSGTYAKQHAVLQREAQAVTLRVFEPATIPGLLQTPDYARHILAKVVSRHDVPDDVDDGVHARMQRQEILYRSGRRFHFVLTEAALRYRRCPPEAMVGQLDRIIALSAMRTLRLGIIPFDVELPESPMHGFWIFDNRMVVVETISAELTLEQQEEIGLYGQVFGQLASAAVYGSDAREIATSALADIARQ